MLHLLHRCGCQPQLSDAGVFGLDIVHAHRKVPIGAAMRIGFGLAVVHGQLHLEIVLAVAQVDEGEGIEGEARGHLQAEGVRVELDGAFLVHDADHRVNQLGHVGSYAACC